MGPKVDFFFKFLYQLVPVPSSVSKWFDVEPKIVETSRDGELLIGDRSGEMQEVRDWNIVIEENIFFQTD